MTVHRPFVPRADFLSFSPPSITEDEIAAVVDTLRSDWITTGPKTRQFEAEFAVSLGAPGALALNSCTAGLHLALASLDIGPGDEVITTPMTFAASVNVIEHVGATPVLADVEPDTLNLDPARAAERITPRTRAILPVHYGGHPAEMRPLLELARAHGLAVIEDAAHALPAKYEGQAIGTLGDFAAFSFYATKNLTTAEGGMLTGAPERLARARILSLHGMSRDAWKRYSTEGSWFYEVVEPGFKYNMTDIQAAMGLVQLGRLEAMQARRRAIVARYQAAFGAMPELQPYIARPNVESAWHLFPLRLQLDRLKINRSEFIEALKQRNIGTSVHFIPIHLHPYYRDKYGWQADDFPVARREYQRILSLPLHPRLTEADVTDVIAAVADVVEQKSMLKRAFDVAVSLAALIALSPLLIVLALIVRGTSPGPALHRPQRIGLNGQPFTLYKFRSMVTGAHRTGPGITGVGDSRVTPIGRVLRRTKLDELPQLFNVLRGDMSLVGPRPEDPRYVALYTPEQREVLRVRPGITSAASVAFRNEEALLGGADWETVYIEQIMPAKLATDLDYVRHPSVWRDLVILAQTAAALFR